jgi:dihydrofolate synthase/folylpolyglutamate synthase
MWLTCLEHRHPQEIQLGLTRIKTVADKLELCDLKAQVITVAGTNGKGSTVTALEAIYQAAGFQVASYTSPHLLRFNERIRINQVPISDEALCDAFTLIEQARGDTHLTYFEMTTLAALYYFQQHNLDVIILEVGIGGRLDATNIVDADLAIISTIDFDHEDYLGHSLEAIGAEKAGVLRNNQPLVYADFNPPLSIVNRAEALQGRMYCLGQDYFFQATDHALLFMQQDGAEVHLPKPNIHSHAAAAAVMASILLKHVLPVSVSQLSSAMQQMSIAGRRQVISGDVTTILDVSHNPQAVSLLAQFIKDYPVSGTIHAVFSAFKDKDVQALIRIMSSCVDVWYPALLDGVRASDEDFLRTSFQAAGQTVETCFSNPVAAYDAALLQAQPGDVIVVFGSFLTVSPVLAAKF